MVDPARVSVGGHSYGAFMAANLVAHAPEVRLSVAFAWGAWGERAQV